MSDVRKVIEISWAKPVASDDLLREEVRRFKGKAITEGWYGEDLHMHGDRLAITGAVSDPRARTIGPQRRKRPIICAMLVLTLSAIAWGVVYMGVWAIACLWRWAEPLAAIIGIGAAIAAFIVGIGLPG